MARKVRAREAEEQALDLTPMLDVTFILLIFFIVTAQFIKLPGVDISRTDAENDNNIAPLGIIIAIDESFLPAVWIVRLAVRFRRSQTRWRLMHERT